MLWISSKKLEKKDISEGILGKIVKNFVMIADFGH